MKISKRLKRTSDSLIIICFITVIITLSCHKDNGFISIIPSNNTKPYEKLKIESDLTAFNLFGYVNNFTKAEKGSDSLLLPEEVVKTINQNGKTSYSFKIEVSEDSPYFRDLVVTKTMNGWVGYYLDYYPEISWLYGNDSFPTMRTFEGRIKKYDLSFNLIYTSFFKDGKMYKYTLKDSKSANYCMQVTNSYFWIDGIGQVENCDQYVSSSTGISYSDCYLVLQGYEVPCSNTTSGGTNTEPTWPDGSIDTGTPIPGDGTTTGGGGSTTGDPNGTTQGVNNPNFPVIDASDLLANPKMNCVYTNLVQTNLMKRYVKDFDGNFPVTHLRYTLSDNLAQNVYGSCSPLPVDYWLTISINKNRVADLPPLILAEVLIHETIHAELKRALVSVHLLPSTDNFPGLFDYYTRYINGGSATTPQHQLMAQHYINIIASALKEYDSSQHPDQFYTDLAWIGLEGTVAWNNLDSTEMDRITSAIGSYRSNGPKNCTSNSIPVE